MEARIAGQLLILASHIHLAWLLHVPDWNLRGLPACQLPSIGLPPHTCQAHARCRAWSRILVWHKPVAADMSQVRCLTS